MDENIGRTLGVTLALYQSSLTDDPDNMEWLSRIELVSSAYKNFINAGLEGFEEAFRNGYEAGKRDMSEDPQLEGSVVGTPKPKHRFPEP